MRPAPLYIRDTSCTARIFALLVGIKSSWLLISQEDRKSIRLKTPRKWWAGSDRNPGPEFLGTTGGINSESAITGWSPEQVRGIRRVYVDRGQIAVAIGERLRDGL